jgi:CRISPR system Cascade subunit CasE
MSDLMMISLPVDMRALRHCAGERGYAIDEGRALHHFLSEAFGKGALQPFRLMVAPGSRRATLYAYSDRPAAHLTEQSDTATPELAKIFNLPDLAVKEMPSEWRAGRRLAFDLRIRPVRRLMKPLDGWSHTGRRAEAKGATLAPFRKGAEVDAFLVDRLRYAPDGVSAEETTSREEVYFTWLVERLNGAVTLDRNRTRLVRFERTCVARDATSEGPDATLHGEFTVDDGSMLNERLLRGIGRHTAYGYGMLLLRPARE